MIPVVYMDTSVIGGVYDPEFMPWSERLIENVKTGMMIAMISDLTLKELDKSPGKVKEIVDGISDECKKYVTLNNEMKELAKKYILEGVITSKNLVDAQHISIATITRADVLVSWNFRHIVNLNRIRSYNAVNLKSGFQMLEIRTPREVLGDE